MIKLPEPVAAKIKRGKASAFVVPRSMEEFFFPGELLEIQGHPEIKVHFSHGRTLRLLDVTPHEWASCGFSMRRAAKTYREPWTEDP